MKKSLCKLTIHTLTHHSLNNYTRHVLKGLLNGLYCTHSSACAWGGAQANLPSLVEVIDCCQRAPNGREIVLRFLKGVFLPLLPLARHPKKEEWLSRAPAQLRMRRVGGAY